MTSFILFLLHIISHEVVSWPTMYYHQDQHDTLVTRDHSERYRKALEKGRELLPKTQFKQPDDQQVLITLDQLQQDQWFIQSQEKAQLPPDVAFALGVPAPDDCISVDVAKNAPQGSHAQATYCPSAGIIVSSDRYLFPGERYHWSDIAFAVWRELITKPSIYNLNHLLWFVAYDIDNPETIDLLFEAFGDPQVGEVIRKPPNSDEVKVLLGSPNGYGFAYFLFQHQDEGLGVQAIGEGLAWDAEGTGKWCFATRVVAKDPPPPQIVVPQLPPGTIVSNKS